MRMKRIAALLLCLCLVLTMAGAAAAVDLTKPVSLTLKLGALEFTEDLPNANIAVDLYLVASATEMPEYDSYSYTPEEPFEELTIPDFPENGDWRALSQLAAGIALEEGNDPTVTATGETSAVFDELEPGLYLVVARGADIEDYVTTVTDDEENERIATIARSPVYEYTFTPELISLPAKPADDEGVINTANDGDWIYDQTATLKSERAERFGDLEITKTLLTYGSRPATFVFRYEYEDAHGQTVGDVVSLTFTEPGVERVLVEHLPVNAEVTVTEVYTGASYRLVSDASQTAVISADELASVAFTNDYISTPRSGHGITNSFVYPDGETGWEWTQMIDNRAE